MKLPTHCHSYSIAKNHLDSLYKCLREERSKISFGSLCWFLLSALHTRDTKPSGLITHHFVQEWTKQGLKLNNDVKNLGVSILGISSSNKSKRNVAPFWDQYAGLTYRVVWALETWKQSPWLLHMDIWTNYIYIYILYIIHIYIIFCKKKKLSGIFGSSVTYFGLLNWSLRCLLEGENAYECVFVCVWMYMCIYIHAHAFIFLLLLF